MNDSASCRCIRPVRIAHGSFSSLRSNVANVIMGMMMGVVALTASPIWAGDTSGRDHAKRDVKPLTIGDAVGAFYVTKIAGAEDDGVETGSELCYRCRYGSRPMVMVFTRETSGKVPVLVHELDKAVNANKKSQLRGLVTVLGDDAAKVKDDANQVAEKAGAKTIPVVVAKDTSTGPINYKLSENVDVTIVVASDSKVVSARTFDAESIDIAAVMSDVKKILK